MSKVEWEPSKAEFEVWKNDPVTKYIVSVLEETKTDVSNFLCNGGTLNKNSPMTTDYIVGRIQGLNDFLNVEYEEKVEYGH